MPVTLGNNVGARCNDGGDDVIVIGVIGYNSRTGVWRNKIDGLDIIASTWRAVMSNSASRLAGPGRVSTSASSSSSFWEEKSFMFSFCRIVSSSR